MDSTVYEGLRQFADSWGLVYMFAIFVAVAVMILRPGAKSSARDAARIPLDDDIALPGDSK